MTGAEFKEIEGKRLQQVLSAVSALPAAFLVFGDSPALSAPGAPFFMAAIAAGVGSLMFMSYTDSIFYLDETDFRLPDEHLQAWVKMEEDLEKEGGPVQLSSLIYGCTSLMLSFIGVAAVFSPLRTEVSVTTGFILSLCFGLSVCFHISYQRLRLNTITNRYRQLSVHHSEPLVVHNVCLRAPAPY